MSNWEQFADIVAMLLVASVAWISTALAPDGPIGSLAPAGVSTPGQNQLGSIMRWAQQEDEPPIEQVGEDTNADVETLDEAAPPVEEGDLAEDVELLDHGPPADVQDDAELLDQGPPPAPVAESTAPSTVTAEPVTTYVAPAAANGPFVPEGFGTGSVHVSTGAAGFPVGLEDCHVGAVTGRAYVGIHCGDGRGSFVGHAPSFEEFPFVPNESFPFGQESVFADRGGTQIEDNVQTLISAARGVPDDADASAPVIRTSGASSVAFEQRARDKKLRIESENGRAKRGNGSRRDQSADVTSSESRARGDQASTEPKKETTKRGKDSNGGASSADAEKKSKSSKKGKKQGDKKGNKRQNSQLTDG